MLYLADAGKNGDVTSIASVSGGSITNGFIAQEIDFRATNGPSFAQSAAPFANRLATRGTFQGSKAQGIYKIAMIAFGLLTAGTWAVPNVSRITRYAFFVSAVAVWAFVFLRRLFGAAIAKAYIVILATTAAAALVPFWVLPLPAPIASPAARFGLFIVALLVWSATVFHARSWVCELALRSAFFNRDGDVTKLSQINGTLDHVFCATELQSGDHLYLARDFVYGYRFGKGQPGDLPLSTAVQASACLPGAFSPRWLRTDRHTFRYERDDCPDERNRLAELPPFVVLSDGGVYDNMADQWAQGFEGRVKCSPSLGIRPAPHELIVVNASAGLDFKRMRSWLVPSIGEVMALLKIKSVLYDQTTAHRRQGLVGRFDRAISSGRGLKGALVHIPQSPWQVAESLSTSWMEDRAERARDVLSKLPGTKEEWIDIARRNASVPTTLRAIGLQDSARLLFHAYVLANASLHMILNWRLLDFPSMDRFEALVRGPG